MESKDKAIELYNKFYNTSSHPHHIETRQQIAKKCALIAVDEIIEATKYEISHAEAYIDGRKSKINTNVYYNPYWQEVKQEIEKL